MVGLLEQTAKCFMGKVGLASMWVFGLSPWLFAISLTLFHFVHLSEASGLV